MLCACAALLYVDCLAVQYRNLKYVFIFSKKEWSETLFVIRIIERVMNVSVYWASCKITYYSYQISVKLEFSRQYEIFANIKSHEYTCNQW